MTDTKRPPQPAEVARPGRILRKFTVRVAAPSLLLALTPKCFICVAAYASAGAALQLGGAELCGGSNSSNVQWLAWLPAVGIAVVATYGFAGQKSRAAKRDTTTPVSDA